MTDAEYIVHGDYLIPVDAEAGTPRVLRDHAVAVEGGKISAIGPLYEIQGRFRSKRVIGGKDKVVLPGLINTHTHAAMSLMRGMADDLPLKEWLGGHIWPAEDKWLSPEFIEDATRLACLEMLKAGITAYGDMYFYEGVSAGVAKKLGMRAVLGAGIVDFPTKTGSSSDDYLRNAESFINDLKGDALVMPCLAPHSAYACGPDTLKKTALLAGKYGVLVHTHLSETKGEVAEALTKFGRTPGMLLADSGILEGRVLVAHAVWLTKREMEIFAEKGVCVSHCVESNLKLASGIAPVPEMLRKGIKVTFGTDGAASNNDLNLLSEMSTAAKLHKAMSADPTVMGAGTVILMATRWAAESLGLGEITGSLEAGKSADIVVADIRKPHLSPVYNVLSHIVYSMRPSDVDSVMVGGRLVVDSGRLLSADEGEILDKACYWGRKIGGGR